jgi:hypothetical protein
MRATSFDVLQRLVPGTSRGCSADGFECGTVGGCSTSSNTRVRVDEFFRLASGPKDPKDLKNSEIKMRCGSVNGQ